MNELKKIPPFHVMVRKKLGSIHKIYARAIYMSHAIDLAKTPNEANDLAKRWLQENNSEFGPESIKNMEDLRFHFNRAVDWEREHGSKFPGPIRDITIGYGPYYKVIAQRLDKLSNKRALKK